MFISNTKTVVKVKRKLPLPTELSAVTVAERLIIFYDRKLSQKSFFLKWLSKFKYSCAVDAGETLKDLRHFERLTSLLLPMTAGVSPNACTLVTVGGGTIGDVGGFLASVIKRGISLVHIPSTWLAAVDSAYGGKTAMNVKKFKNQIGTFYPATAVFCVEELLINEPDENLISGYGEAQKMALLSGGALFEKMAEAPLLDANLLWKLLPDLSRAKMRVVETDPFEKSGERAVLNLGHTFGHAIELESNLSHGAAVRVGLEFAVRFSVKKNIMAKKEMDRVLGFLDRNPISRRPPVSADILAEAIANDKKSAGNERVRFVFLKKPGRPVVQPVGIAEICKFAKEIGWCK